MNCIKTGCQLFLEQYHQFAIGDAYEGDDFYVFRIVNRASVPFRPTKHFTVKELDHWFQDQPISTMLAYAQHVGGPRI